MASSVPCTWCGDHWQAGKLQLNEKCRDHHGRIRIRGTSYLRGYEISPLQNSRNPLRVAVPPPLQHAQHVLSQWRYQPFSLYASATYLIESTFSLPSPLPPSKGAEPPHHHRPIDRIPLPISFCLFPVPIFRWFVGQLAWLKTLSML